MGDDCLLATSGPHIGHINGRHYTTALRVTALCKICPFVCWALLLLTGCLGCCTALLPLSLSSRLSFSLCLSPSLPLPPVLQILNPTFVVRSRWAEKDLTLLVHEVSDKSFSFFLALPVPLNLLAPCFGSVLSWRLLMSFFLLRNHRNCNSSD